MNNFITSSTNSSSFNYKVKLLGILPTGIKPLQITGCWKTNNLQVCKKPSEDGRQGQLDVLGHPNLVDTAMIERKHKMAEMMWRTDDSDDSESDDDTIKTSEVKKDETANHLDNSADNPDTSVNESPSSSDPCGDKPVKNETSTKDQDSEKEREPPAVVNEEEQKELAKLWQPATKFLHRCFDPKSFVVPDIVCERLIPIFLATEPDPFVLIARKIKFTPKLAQEPIQFIQISVLTSADDTRSGWTGPFFAKWAVQEPTAKSDRLDDDKPSSNSTTRTRSASIPSANKSANGKKSDSDSSSEEDDDDDGFPHHHAFLEARIEKVGEENRGLNLCMVALIGAVWKLEENPENYTCAHLSEMRTAMDTTVASVDREGKPNSFYKSVRMRRNYWQSHLAGEKNYLVGINKIVKMSDARSKRVIKELRLYDVEDIPRVIRIDAEKEGFEPWTVDQLNSRFFNSLQLIQETVQKRESDEIFLFIKYNEFDLPVYDDNRKLFQIFQATQKLVIVSGLNPPKFTSAQQAYRTGAEVLATIIESIGYPATILFPSFKWTNHQTDLELMFGSSDLATCFVAAVQQSWKKRRQNVPVGLENLRIQKKPIKLPKGHPLWKPDEEEKASDALLKSQKNGGERPVLNLAPVNPRASNFDRAGGGTAISNRPFQPMGQWRGSAPLVGSSTSGQKIGNVYRHPAWAKKFSSASDQDDNWRK